MVGPGVSGVAFRSLGGVAAGGGVLSLELSRASEKDVELGGAQAVKDGRKKEDAVGRGEDAKHFRERTWDLLHE